MKDNYEGTFGYLEYSKDVNIDVITQFIEDGEIDGKRLIIIRNAHSEADSNLLRDKFYDIMDSHGSDRADDGFVKNQQIGSSQFHKTGSEYLLETVTSAPNVMELFNVLPPETVRNIFLDERLEAAFASRGIVYGPARHAAFYGNFATTRRWLNNGKMALHPHDDSAQLGFAAEDGFEIARGRHTIAANFCISEEDPLGSNLVVWNRRPDDAERTRFGLEKTGYPYPIEYVDQFEKIKVKVRTGDLYFLNASYIHGVENSASNNRITSGRFITHFDNKVVYWT
jgi:hypothetical protein